MPQSARKQLLAQLPSQCLLNPDETIQDCVDRWLRMHRGRRPIVAVRLRFVRWAQMGQPSRRFVWELCKWPKAESFEWMFVCWLLDEVGMWWKVAWSGIQLACVSGVIPLGFPVALLLLGFFARQCVKTKTLGKR